MFRHNCPEADALVAFLYDDFDSSASDAAASGGKGSDGRATDRRAIARHLDGCSRCTAEVASLRGLRQTLREWTAPEMTLGFRVVSEPPRRFAWLPAWAVPTLPLAAAATLVLGGALGLARFDIQYDSQGGLHVRTGWGHGTDAAVVNAGVSPTSSAPAAVGVTPVPAAASAAAGTPWRAEMQTLERQIRQEMAALRHSGSDRVTAASVLAGDSSAPASDRALVRRVQQLIDQSEVRQQQNLALRTAELSREFDLQRRSDLVRIEQGFGRLADQRAQDAESQRQFLNTIRVSQQQPQ